MRRLPDAAEDGVEFLPPPRIVNVEQVDVFPSQVDEQFATVRAKGEVGAGQGPEQTLVVGLLLRQVACDRRTNLSIGR